MTEIDPVRLPDGLITVTPLPDSLEFTYQRIGGNDLISVMLDDARVGRFRTMLTPEAAQFVAMSLWAMVSDLETLRRQWNHGEESR